MGLGSTRSIAVAVLFRWGAIVRRGIKEIVGSRIQFQCLNLLCSADGMDVVDEICAVARPINNIGLLPASSQPVITSVTIRTEPAS